MFKYWVIGLLTLSMSLGIFIFKGYLNIRNVSARDQSVITYLEKSSVTNVPFFLISSVQLKEDLEKNFTWLKDPKISVSPGLKLKVEYANREPSLITDKESVYVSNEGVLFEDLNVTHKISSKVPKFIIGAEELGTSVMRSEDLSYITSLKLYPNLVISKTDEKIFIKPEGHSWYLEVIALSEFEENAKSTNSLINSLLESGDSFSSIVVLGDRLIVKD